VFVTIEAIKLAIGKLSSAERDTLGNWFDDLREQEWDERIDRDFAPGGRADALVARLDREIDAGQFTSLKSGPRSES
jgi:hypothetical protein